MAELQTTQAVLVSDRSPIPLHNLHKALFSSFLLGKIFDLTRFSPVFIITFVIVDRIPLKLFKEHLSILDFIPSLIS
jgi:hypothetical protein